MRSAPSPACLTACIIALAAGSGSPAAHAAPPDRRFSVEVEAGAVWQSRN